MKKLILATLVMSFLVGVILQPVQTDASNSVTNDRSRTSEIEEKKTGKKWKIDIKVNEFKDKDNKRQCNLKFVIYSPYTDKTYKKIKVKLAYETESGSSSETNEFWISGSNSYREFSGSIVDACDIRSGNIFELEG